MSRSVSRSESESRSPSEDSMALPSNPMPADDHPHPPQESDLAAANPGANPAATLNTNDGRAAPGATSPAASFVSLFIGLGPAARSIRSDDLKKVLQDAASTPEAVLDVRMRGRCAFADVTTREEASRLIAALDGQMFEDKARMAVQMSEHRREEAPRRGPGAPPGAFNGGRLSLFVGLGPAGAGISDEEIKSKLEEAVPILALRRRGQCAFVEVATSGDAEKLLRTMNNQYIGEARLAVQYSRESGLTRKRERGDRRVGRGAEDRPRGHRERSRSRERRTRRRRSESRERRRGRRGSRRSRSLTPSSVRSYSSYSSDRSRGARRSRSYSSSRGSSVSHDHRERRGRRDRRRSGGSRRA